MVKVNLTALNVNVVESELFGHKKGSFTGATEDKKGFFEVANQSSLFIDEIGDFPLNLQSKILRVLQEKKIMVVGSTKEVEIDTRLIFATNKNLETMIKEATFRQDLYFRISTFTVELPPLRDRLEDIDILAPHFLNDFLIENNLEYKVFSPDAIEKLKQHHYPGNIRELAKIIKNSTLFSENEVITAQDIEFQTEQQQMDIWLKTRNLSLTESKKCFEKEFLIKRLKQMNRNIEKTAESLGIIRNNLYRKLREYDIEWN